MKLSKLLLGALVAGVTVAGTTSCSKDAHEVTVQNTPGEETTPPPVITPNPDPCPVCGMG